MLQSNINYENFCWVVGRRLSGADFGIRWELLATFKRDEVERARAKIKRKDQFVAYCYREDIPGDKPRYILINKPEFK